MGAKESVSVVDGSFSFVPKEALIKTLESLREL
jgi:hypothetical protein